MAMLKYGHAAVTTPIVDPFKWVDKKVAKSRVVVAKEVIAKFDPAKWLLTHCSIMASVDTDLADPKDKKSNYLIKPEYSIFVNNNGDCWERELLRKASKSFLGADNYIEHVQIPLLSKGKVIDVALREVPFSKDIEGKDLTTLYVDVLIATDRKHTDVIDKISSGEYSALSMGCGLAGTKIILPNGSLYNIEDIKVGDFVLTHKGVSKHVTNLFQKHVSDIPLYSVDYVGANEPLRLTGEHPILIATEKSIKCECQNETCRVDKHQSLCWWNSKKRGKVKIECGRDKDAYKYDMKFVPISEVSVGDYIAKVYPTDIKDNNEFTEDVCRLLGLYVGEGYIGWQWEPITKEKLYPAYIGFCLGMHETDLIKEIKDLLDRIVQVGTTITYKDVPERNGVYINVYDKFLASFLLKHCGEGAWNKTLSEDIMLLPANKQMKIISGMFDSDGCYYEKNKSLHYSSVSENLINQLHLMLLRNKIGNAREKVLRQGSGKKKEAHYQETVFISKSFSYMVPCNKNKAYGIPPVRLVEYCFFFENYFLCRITNVNSLRFSGVVYNFSVEDDESYSVNNAAVHNCLIKYSYCSQCGKKAADESESCQHVRFYKSNFFFDKGGVKRIIAEICGDVDDPDSCKFVDASWVRKPAFEGAVLRNIVNIPTEDVSEKADKLIAMPSFEKKPGMYLKAAAKAAEEVVQELLSQDDPPAAPATEAPAAEAPAAEAPKDDVRFPEALPESDKPLETDTPAPEEAPAEMPPAEAPGAMGAPGGAMGAPPAAPAPQIDEPKTDATVQELKDMVKKQLLNQMRRELLKDQALETNRPTTSDNATNSSLVKDASSMKKILKEAQKISNSKLLNGILILSNIDKWSQFKKYGYGRNDVLAIMAFVDKTLSNSPVSPDAVRALSSMKTSSDDLKSLFTNIIVETGRKPGKAESMKLASWSKILRYFE